MNRALAAGKALLEVIAALSILALVLPPVGLVGVYEFLAVRYLVDATASDLGIQPLLIYVSVPVLLGAFFALSGVDDLVFGPRERGWRWRTRVALWLLIALCLSLVVQLMWSFLVGGLLVGPGRPRSQDELGPIGHIIGLLLSVRSALSPTLALAVGAAVGLPLAARTFWSFSPFHVFRGNVHLLLRPFDEHDGRRAPDRTAGRRSSSERRSPPASTTVSTPTQPPRSRGTARRWGFVWIGIIVGFGTMAGIAAGFDQKPTFGKVLLAALASAVAGGIAAAQWRITVRRG